MGAVTYPNEQVQQAISDGFVPYRIDMTQRHPDYKDATNGGRVMWGPTFVVLDGRGLEVRRWVGWLPPESFVAELEFTRALAAFNAGKFEDATAAFDHVVDRHGGTEIHPEAIYWQGIAGFMAGKKDWDRLRASWSRVAAEYPGHRFATHASVIEDAPES